MRLVAVQAITKKEMVRIRNFKNLMVVLSNKLRVLEVLRRRLRGQSRQHRRWLSESNTREMFFWPEA